MPRRTLYLTAAVATVLLAGCDRRMAKVRGEVLLDGKPLAEGTIRFESIAGTGPTAGDIIENGRFEVEATRGPNRVELNAWEVVLPKKPRDPNNPREDATTRELIPKQYNTKSTLVVDVGADRSEVKFDLRSK
jgi:hypothetical protein